MKFATWNMRFPGKKSIHRRIEFLLSFDWDIIALQEVTVSAWQALSDKNLPWTGFSILEGFGIDHTRKRPYGAAILVKPDVQTGRLYSHESQIHE